MSGSHVCTQLAHRSCTNNMEPENYGGDMGREWVRNTNVNLTCCFLT